MIITEVILYLDICTKSIFVTTILPKIWDSELFMKLNFQILIWSDPKLALHIIACRLFMKYTKKDPPPSSSDYPQFGPTNYFDLILFFLKLSLYHFKQRQFWGGSPKFFWSFRYPNNQCFIAFLRKNFRKFWVCVLLWAQFFSKNPPKI